MGRAISGIPSHRHPIPTPEPHLLWQAIVDEWSSRQVYVGREEKWYQRLQPQTSARQVSTTVVRELAHPQSLAVGLLWLLSFPILSGVHDKYQYPS